jgi:hypothetical protein
MAKSLVDKAIELKNWETFISNMSTIQMNENYQYSKPKNAYYLFTDHIKCWIQGLKGSRQNDSGDFVYLGSDNMTEEEKAWEIVRFNSTDLDTDWWKVALNGQGKKDSPLPRLKSTLSEEDAKMAKEQIYATLLPLYRALEEAHAKRWFLEWFYNHRQYTAERDTMKVLKNLMMYFTGDSKEAFDERCGAYKDELPNSDIAQMRQLQEERARAAQNLRENMALGQAEREAEEEALAYEEQKKNQQQKEVEQVKNKAEDNLTMKEQWTLLNAQENFKGEVVNEFLEVVNKDAPNQRLGMTRKLMLPAQAYTPMMEEAKKLCDLYDEWEDPSVYNEEAEKIVKDGVKAMFKAAFQAAKNLRITDLKQQIIVAQKFTDIILNRATPVAFNQNQLGDYGKGYIVMQNADVIREIVQGDEAAMNDAIQGAQEEFGKLYPEIKVNESEQLNIILNEDENMEVVPPVEHKADSNEKTLSSLK